MKERIGEALLLALVMIVRIFPRHRKEGSRHGPIRQLIGKLFGNIEENIQTLPSAAKGMRQRHRFADALRRRRFPFAHRRIIPSVGIMPQRQTVFAETLFYKGRRQHRHIADGIHADLPQRRHGAAAGHEEKINGHGPQLRFDLMGPESVDTIGLFPFRSHFGRGFARGDTDIDGETQFFFDPLLQIQSRFFRRAEKFFLPRHIQKAFVDGKRFHRRRIFS